MDDPHDLRDLGGRLVRVILSIVLGIPSAFAIAFAIPYAHRTAGTELAPLALIAVGCIGCAVAWHAIFGLVWRARPHVSRANTLPRARVVVRSPKR